MSRDLHITLWDASISLYPFEGRPFLTFGNATIDRGSPESLGIEGCPSVHAVVADQTLFDQTCERLSRETGFLPEQYFGYICVSRLSRIEFNFGFPLDQAVRFVNEMKQFVGRPVQLSVSLDCTDFVEERWQDGTFFRLALIDGPISVAVSGKE